MSNILVTGGLGFIGHHVVNRLEDLGHNVVIVDSGRNHSMISHAELKYLISERRKYIKTQQMFFTSINDDWAIKALMEDFNPETVIHLASFPRQKAVEEDPLTATRTMCDGLANMLEASKKANVSRFVYISSSMVYGDFSHPVTEQHPILNPKSMYGIWKLAGELLTKSYASDQMSYTIIRPSAVYGPRDISDRVISRFLLNAKNNDLLPVNGRTEKVDFTHVSDVADGIVAAALTDKAANQTYNISRGNARLIYDAARIAIDIVGKGLVEIKNRDMTYSSRYSLDCSKARSELGFSPSIDIEQGMREQFDWIDNSSFWRTRI